MKYVSITGFSLPFRRLIFIPIRPAIPFSLCHLLQSWGGSDLNGFCAIGWRVEGTGTGLLGSLPHPWTGSTSVWSVNLGNGFPIVKAGALQVYHEGQDLCMFTSEVGNCHVKSWGICRSIISTPAISPTQTKVMMYLQVRIKQVWL